MKDKTLYTYVDGCRFKLTTAITIFILLAISSLLWCSHVQLVTSNHSINSQAQTQEANVKSSPLDDVMHQKAIIDGNTTDTVLKVDIDLASAEPDLRTAFPEMAEQLSTNEDLISINAFPEGIRSEISRELSQYEEKGFLESDDDYGYEITQVYSHIFEDDEIIISKLRGRLSSIPKILKNDYEYYGVSYPSVSRLSPDEIDTFGTIRRVFRGKFRDHTIILEETDISGSATASKIVKELVNSTVDGHPARARKFRYNESEYFETVTWNSGGYSFIVSIIGEQENASEVLYEVAQGIVSENKVTKFSDIEKSNEGEQDKEKPATELIENKSVG